MFKLVVLSACVAVAFAKPGYIHGGVVSYGAPLVHDVTIQHDVVAPAVVGSAVVGSVPTAVSHQSRTDFHHKAVVEHYAPAVVAPVIAPAVVDAPAVVSTYSAPAVVGEAIVGSVPTAVSHQSRTDVHHKTIVEHHVPAVVSAYSAPAVVQAYSAPAIVQTYSAPAVVQAYAAPAVVSTYTAPAVVGSAVVGSVPTAVSHQSRTDIHHKAVVEHHVPAVAYSAPVVVDTPAVVSTYAAPAVVGAAVVGSVPTAVSHQSRSDVHHKTYVEHHVPAVAYAAAPLAYAAHVPAAYGYSYGYAHAAPVVHAW